MARTTPPPLPRHFATHGQRCFLPEFLAQPLGATRVTDVRHAAPAASPRRSREAELDWLLIALIMVAVTTTTFAVVTALQAWPGPHLAVVNAPPRTAASQRRQQAAALAQSTLSALHDANRTGNYAVLRALAAPDFQAANSVDDLARIFAGQRKHSLDLAATVAEQPTWEREPDIDADGLLRLVGSYPVAGGLRLHVELAYQPIAGHWRLFDIAVTLRPVTATASTHPAGR